MSWQNPEFHRQLEAVDDQRINPSRAAGLASVAVSRRTLLKGIGAASLASLLPSLLSACTSEQKEIRNSLLGFQSVAAQTSSSFDSVIVPSGYRATPFFSWGDAVLPGAPAWRSDASNSWEDQLMQAGDNNDGMHYFPFADQPNEHGLLVVNHEYGNPTLHPNGMQFTQREDNSRDRPAEQVYKEMAAHGLSIIEIRRDASGQWQRVADSKLNRRITASTPMTISGPLAGHTAMRTESDPSGLEVLGTINNCSMGATPWQTYLACEENFHNYFVNRDEADYNTRSTHKRYGIGLSGSSRYYAWESVDPRFNATPDADRPYQGHVNEPNRFGWVVEVDPFNPNDKPRKRTAMGRLGRECATCVVDERGHMAVYSGDDARGEYVYKFVPERPYKAGDIDRNRDLLDSGTLYAARFDADGRGEWLPLRWGAPGLTPENGFADQHAVLLNARGAADAIGATPMDRPEWVAAHPQTREMYVSLTNNTERGKADPTDAANPREENVHGQILRWREAGADPWATEFEWDLFVLAGERQKGDGSVPANRIGNIEGDLFSSPDGMTFDPDGRLWILTDAEESVPYTADIGCNQMLCADPVSREIRRFLVGPRGAEITGITWTPDARTMWVNVQHPGMSYPASDGVTRPRSTTVMITRQDGGVIGT